MARTKMPWFRYWTDTAHDPKMRAMPVEHRHLWTMVLSAARESSVPGCLMVSDKAPMTAAQLADYAALPKKVVEAGMKVFMLEETGPMVDDGGPCGAWRVIKWDGRQPVSDNVTERTRKHRSKEQVGNVPSPLQETDLARFKEQDIGVPGNDLGTPLDTEADTDTEAAATAVSSPPPPASPAAAAEDLIEQALTLIAKRRLTSKVSNPVPYIRSAIAGLRRDHADAIATLDLAFFATPELLAEHLEPSPKPPEPDPFERAQAASRRIADANERRKTDPCPKCAGEKFLAVGDAVTPCPDCRDHPGAAA